MKIKKAVKSDGVKLLEKKTHNFEHNINDVVRMKFLEQSAKYLGVSVKIDSIDLVDVKTTN